MNWISKYWKQAILGACAAVNATAYYVPALLPIAQACAVIVPGIAGAPTAKDALKAIVAKFGSK